MNDAAVLEDALWETAEFEATLKHYLSELDRMLSEMEARHRRTELLGVQTDARLDHVFDLLARP